MARGEMTAIGCLMVTKPDRHRMPLIRRSLDCYCRQTHPDRELVILVDPRASRDAVADLTAMVEAHGRGDIRLRHASPCETLGAMRNRSLSLCSTEVVCQWDDDDLSHPLRLARQHETLRAGGHEAVVLQEVMHYFPGSEALYLGNWAATPAGGHPGTLMALRGSTRYPRTGAHAARGEDLAAVLDLRARGALGHLRGEPHLFVYVSHGRNTWPDDHHAMLARELGVSAGLLRRREGDLRRALAPFDLPRDTIAMTGSNGVAFRL